MKKIEVVEFDKVFEFTYANMIEQNVSMVQKGWLEKRNKKTQNMIIIILAQKSKYAENTCVV